MIDPILTFFLSLLFAFFLYYIGSKIAPKGTYEEEKYSAFASGERGYNENIRAYFDFMMFAIYFMIFDISGLILATSLSNPGQLALLYIAITLITIVALFHEEEGKGEE
ncbi:MAG: NADH-quinone oxidoreductase subunit A [Candidatus Asgardarchaeia archaeon]